MKRFFFIVGLALLTIGASLPPGQVAQFFAVTESSSVVCVDVAQSFTTADGGQASSSQYSANKITASGNHVVCGMVLQFAVNAGETADFTFHIWADNAGNPDPANVIATGETFTSQEIRDAGVNYLTNAISATLTTSANYWLGYSRSSASGLNVTWQRGNTSPEFIVSSTDNWSTFITNNTTRGACFLLLE